MILHQSTKNYDHMMYSCRVMTQDRQMEQQTEGWTYRGG